MLTRKQDPYLNLRFKVEIMGLIVGDFAEVAGLEAEIEIEDYREGGVNDYIHKLPKIAKYPNLILKRGFTDSSALWLWHWSAIHGVITRLPGRIILMDYQGNEKWRWLFLDAYPVKWKGPDFKADGNTVAIESLELVHHGLISF